jgi:dynein heavy chain
MNVFLQVKAAAVKLGYQADETFCLKISQLRELFVVRWSVFLLGPAGCGKTAIWQTLKEAQNSAGEKTVSSEKAWIYCRSLIVALD